MMLAVFELAYGIVKVFSTSFMLILVLPMQTLAKKPIIIRMISVIYTM